MPSITPNAFNINDYDYWDFSLDSYLTSGGRIDLIDGILTISSDYFSWDVDLNLTYGNTDRQIGIWGLSADICIDSSGISFEYAFDGFSVAEINGTEKITISTDVSLDSNGVARFVGGFYEGIFLTGNSDFNLVLDEQNLFVLEYADLGDLAGVLRGAHIDRFDIVAAGYQNILGSDFDTMYRINASGEKYVYLGDGHDFVCIGRNSQQVIVVDYEDDEWISLDRGWGFDQQNFRDQISYRYDEVYNVTYFSVYTDTVGQKSDFLGVHGRCEINELAIGYRGALSQGDDLFFTLSFIENFGINYVLETPQFVAGSRYNDRFLGTDGGDTIYGRDGADVLIGGAGDDLIDGGSGDDIIYEQDGNDVVFAGDGDDTIYAGLGADFIDGGDGTDTYIIDATLDYLAVIDLNLGTAYVNGSNPSFNNSLQNLENVTVFSESNFTLIGNHLANVFRGGSGDDLLYGGNNNDKLYGGSGNDRSYGEAGNDSLYMDAGNDTLDGGSGTDWLYVTGSTNSVVNLAKTTGQNTGYGTDIIKNIENASGGSGVDKFYGTSGNNTLKGNNGNDLLYGQNGNDTLYGGNNNDKLYGGSGNDTLRGDAGRDVLQGDAGKDTLYGGADADTFVFRKTSDSSASASGADIIRDFTRGSDKIDLHYIDASTKLSGNNAFTFDGTESFGTSNEGDIYYKQFNNAGTSNDYTMVYIDTDNDTAAEMSIKLMGLHALTASDFIL